MYYERGGRRPQQKYIGYRVQSGGDERKLQAGSEIHNDKIRIKLEGSMVSLGDATMSGYMGVLEETKKWDEREGCERPGASHELQETRCLPRLRGRLRNSASLIGELVIGVGPVHLAVQLAESTERSNFLSPTHGATFAGTVLNPIN